MMIVSQQQQSRYLYISLYSAIRIPGANHNYDFDSKSQEHLELDSLNRLLPPLACSSLFPFSIFCLTDIDQPVYKDSIH